MPTLTSLAKLCAVALLCSTTSQAHAGGIGGLGRSLDRIDAVKRISMQRPTLAPFSYVLFCQQNPGDCRGGATDVITMTPSTRQTLAAINRHVNRSIEPRHDRTDVWSADSASGDCEDYALTKRRALIRAGLPASALFMAVARTRAGEGHAVLVARTTAGDLVLDNRSNVLREWYRTDLSWLKIASGENPRLWYAAR
ncbi:transglutaminase-like cysteine peptidase [Jiella pacifica]|uniref:Transglutaminase-like cysteine proteinase n=1 Tax=Jiella pacifica TaxID=2696469 RepID=A0A6N9T3E4_9HYPH|nr:transglutaminase-like cysteine peptidase [Jiella pacifica]NDW04359.1 hypothetical protein [Jiella pacifica]